MKAILVLGEYPSICRECPLCNTSNDDDYYCDIIGDVDGEYDGIDQRCPLKPLPKGHGRLKDIDKIEQLLDLDKPDNVIAKALRNIIESVPTIIEADKGEE